MMWNKLQPCPDNLNDYLNRVLGRSPYDTVKPPAKYIHINEDNAGTFYLIEEYDKAPGTVAELTAEEQTALDELLKILESEQAAEPGTDFIIGVA